jgi:hypothetical protein
LRIQTEQIEERKCALKTLQRGDWVPDVLKEPEEEHKLINISGLMFEAPVSVLRRDKDSLLAQLCSAEPPMLPDPDGFFYFDRDWWLFRYILNFLRDGSLPDDRALLVQLYREAGFWHLHEMQVAIEEEKLHLKVTRNAVPTIPPADIKPPWWKKIPTWWQAVDEAKKKAEEETAAKAKPEDWWTGSSYKGKTFLPLSTAPDKVVTKTGEKDVANTLRTTYGLPSGGDIYGHQSSHYGTTRAAAAAAYERAAALHPPLPSNPLLESSRNLPSYR